MVWVWECVSWEWEPLVYTCSAIVWLVYCFLFSCRNEAAAVGKGEDVGFRRMVGCVF